MSAAAFRAVVPAAGLGTRMGAGAPKQYLPLAGATVLEHALRPLLAHPGLQRLVVALAADDDRFPTCALAEDPRVATVTGGDTRAGSVASALAAMGPGDPEGIVLVHDAARPCLGAEDLARLLDAAAPPHGALLAIPVRDTLKRDNGAGQVARTVDRSGLWQALTPQAFPLGALREALHKAGGNVTDEAAAMERAGLAPRLVEGSPANIKITRPGDLPLAEAILSARERGGQ